MIFRCTIVAGTFCVVFSSIGIVAATTPDVAWTRTTSTSATSSGLWVTSDSIGDVFVCGSTDGIAYGAAAGGKGYLAKYDPNGNLLWSNVWASSSVGSMGVAVDSAGNVYAGTGRAVKKFDPSGGLLWNTSLGSSTWGGALGLDANGNAYVTGTTYDPTQDAFVSKISPSGGLLWTTSLKTSISSYSTSIAVDAAGNATIAGNAYDNNYHGTGFLTQFNSSGQVVWNTPFTTSTGSVATDSTGSVYATVNSNLIKYSSGGQKLWSTDFSLPDSAMSIAIDPNGVEYVAAGSGVLKYDSSGHLLGSLSWPNDSLQLAFGNGRLDIVGATFVPPSYTINTYVANVVVPEPSTLVLLSMAAISMLAYAWRRRK